MQYDDLSTSSNHSNNIIIIIIISTCDTLAELSMGVLLRVIMH